MSNPAASARQEPDRVITDQALRPGEPAANFELKDTQGRVHRLADYRNRPLLLVLHRHLA